MLERKLKTALDESRLLILGVQVLFGFQFQSAFQERFAELSPASRAALALSLVLLLLSTGLLITPSLHHQIRFRGESCRGALRAATFYAGWSLLPLTLGLGLSAFVVFTLLFGSTIGAATGVAFTVASLFLLYGWGFLLRTRNNKQPPMDQENPTGLKTKIEQLLTEARVIIPGGQALLGFQFIATLTKAFAELPPPAQVSHAAGLCAVALAVTLLMTPAALHRIAFGGEDSGRFYRIASRIVIAATIPLAAGIAADVGVVFWKVTESVAAAAVAAAATFGVLIAMWLAYPFLRRVSHAGKRSSRHPMSR
jgi:hypothetical protein